MSVRSFGALRDDARLPLPYSGSLGHRFATYQRYYGSLRRLSFRLGLLRLSLVSRYLAVSLFFCMSFGLRETSPNDIRRIGHPAPLHCLTGNVRQGVDRPPRFLAQPSARMPRSMTQCQKLKHFLSLKGKEWMIQKEKSLYFFQDRYTKGMRCE